MIDRELLKGSVSMMVLEMLSRKDMYGYEIIRELEQRSENVFSFKEGTLYPVLHTLEKKGEIYAYWEDTHLARKRKYYHITEKGKAELVDRRAQWSMFTEKVNQVLGGKAHASMYI